jgi:hypothetical protein
MATQITQIELPAEQKTLLRIQGDMLMDDAVLIERLANCNRAENGNRIELDLS